MLLRLGESFRISHMALDSHIEKTRLFLAPTTGVGPSNAAASSGRVVGAAANKGRVVFAPANKGRMVDAAANKGTMVGAAANKGTMVGAAESKGAVVGAAARTSRMVVAFQLAKDDVSTASDSTPVRRGERDSRHDSDSDASEVAKLRNISVTDEQNKVNQKRNKVKLKRNRTR